MPPTTIIVTKRKTAFKLANKSGDVFVVSPCSTIAGFRAGMILFDSELESSWNSKMEQWWQEDVKSRMIPGCFVGTINEGFD